MSENERDALHEVQKYRKIVLVYEALDAEIDELLTAHAGKAEFMSETDLVRYRELARKRDEVLNEMRILEQQLHIDDD